MNQRSGNESLNGGAVAVSRGVLQEDLAHVPCVSFFGTHTAVLSSYKVWRNEQPASLIWMILWNNY